MDDYYDLIADGYSELHKEEQLKKLQVIADNLDVRKEAKLLDVGCGPGYSTDFFECNIIGIDPSGKLLEQCSFKTVKGFAENLPFEDNSFDIVISVTVIHNFKDYQKGLSEIERVGKDRFVFSLLKKSQRFISIKDYIYNEFDVRKVIEEDKDLIIFAQKRNI